LVLSTTSLAGRELARRLPEAEGAFLLPFDAPPPIARVLDRLRPELFVFTETELWPNLLAALGARGIPVALVSGRVSPRAFRRYRWARGLLAEAFRSVSLFGMQSEAEAERLLALGAPAERIAVTGSLKLDAEPPLPSFGVPPGVPLWVAGSTHSGEERACLEAFGNVRRQFPELRLLLAPRHLERLPEVERTLARAGLRWARRTAIGSTWTGDPPVLLLDTLGELAGSYRLGTVAFVGGTLVPVGGHNLIEPARAGLPVLFGPHVEKVEAAARALEASGGGRRVASAADLSEALAVWLADPLARSAAGRAAAQTFPPGENTRKSLRAILRMLAEVRG
jgi:3-deoxy-D-manno-octulosonic-acid transferase